MTTPAAETALLLQDQYTAPWQVALVEALVRWARRERAPGPEDIKRVDASWLHRLAAGRNSLTYTEILGEDYARQSLESTDFFHDQAGYPAATERFARDLGISLQYQYVREGNPKRLTGLDIHVSIPSSVFLGIATLDQYEVYVVETIPKLVPSLFRRVRVFITDTATWSVAFASSVAHVEYQVTGA